MVKGKKYTLTFEAKASEERKAVTGISAPDANWIRYFPDTTIDVGTDWQEYKFDSEMDKADDPNGSLTHSSDQAVEAIFNEANAAYALGEKTKEEALKSFKEQAATTLGY